LAAELRLSFGNAAADYERGRPGWPAEIAEVGGLPREAEVLDLGAGTGKLTRVLARRFERVTAVEPDASMRALCSQATLCCLDGSAEAIPLADHSVDAVFCAEAFHWFDWPVALAEIARVLRPRGTLVLAWNVPSAETEPAFPRAARDVASRYERPGVEAGGVIYQSGAWREPFAGSPFEPLRDEAFTNSSRTGTPSSQRLFPSASMPRCPTRSGPRWPASFGPRCPTASTARRSEAR
jgi:SAM-dependent methyltransferase